MVGTARALGTRGEVLAAGNREQVRARLKEDRERTLRKMVRQKQADLKKAQEVLEAFLADRLAAAAMQGQQPPARAAARAPKAPKAARAPTGARKKQRTGEGSSADRGHQSDDGGSDDDSGYDDELSTAPRAALPQRGAAPSAATMAAADCDEMDDEEEEGFAIRRADSPAACDPDDDWVHED